MRVTFFVVFSFLFFLCFQMVCFSHSVAVDSLPTFVVEKIDLSYVIRNGTTDDIVFSSHNASESFAYAYGGLPGGGRVFVKNGFYNLTNNIRPGNNTVTEGESWQAVLAGEAGCSSVFYIMGKPDGHFVNIRVMDLQIDGSRLSSGKGLYANYVDNLVVENCYVHDTPHTGIGPDYLVNFTIRNNVVEDCAKKVDGNGIGVGGPSENGSITGNVIRRTGKVSMYGNGVVLEELLNGKPISGVIVSNNNVSSNGNSGFLGKGIMNCTIVGNNFSNNDANGIWVYDWNSAFQGSHGIVIESNACVNNSDAGIRIRGTTVDARDFSVFGNNIAFNSVGFVANTNNTVVVRNSFLNNTLQARCNGPAIVWDGGYPLSGNYWSDYNGTDSNGDGVGDYLIDENNIDRFPVVNPVIPEISFSPILILYVILLSLLVVFHGRRFKVRFLR